MTVCLEWWSVPQWWPVPWRRLHFDTESGRASVALWPCDHLVQGRAWKTGGSWYALRAEGGALVFQVGGTRLPLSAITSIDVTPTTAKRATARIEGDGVVVATSYRHAAGRLWNRCDPTFDGLDEVLQDFFVFLLSVWQSPTRGGELARSWSHSGLQARSRPA